MLFSISSMAAGASTRPIKASIHEKHFGPVSGYFDFYAESALCRHGDGVLQGLEDARRDLQKGQKMLSTRRTKQIMPAMARRAAKWKLEPTTYEGGLAWEGGPAEMIWLGHHNRRGFRYDHYLEGLAGACGPNAVYQEYTFWIGRHLALVGRSRAQYCGEGLKGSASYDGLIRNSHPAGESIWTARSLSPTSSPGYQFRRRRR